jgi:hypothetical protein
MTATFFKSFGVLIARILTEVNIINNSVKLLAYPSDKLSLIIHKDHMEAMRSGHKPSLLRRLLHRVFHSKLLLRCVVGFVVMIVGVMLDRLEPQWIPECVWRSLAWLIHGLGAAPIAKAICEFFGFDFA